MGLINRHDREVLPQKLELLIFVGDDPEDWLFRAEQYFEINRLTPTKKLYVVIVCLEGEALAWYYYEDGRRRFQGWSEFREMILKRLHTLQASTLLDQFFSLRQIDSVREFRRRFETLTGPLHDVVAPVLEIAFVNGLREDIRAELRLWSPIGLPPNHEHDPTN